MKTLISYSGRLGSGKNYCMMKQVDHLKDTGHTIYLISFADPIKKILRDSFGFTKAGKTNKAIPKLTELYVKDQVVDSLYRLIKDLNHEKFDISEKDLKLYITNNYEKYEHQFFGNISGARQAINDSDYGQCFRKLGQLLGTELGRNLVDSIWVDIAIKQVKHVFRADLADYAFIPDCRFINEYTMLNEFKEKTAFDSIMHGVVASDETRALRRGLSMEDLKEQDNHGSESSIDEIVSLLPPENVIYND